MGVGASIFPKSHWQFPEKLKLSDDLLVTRPPPILIWVLVVPFSPNAIGDFRKNSNYQTIFWLKSDPMTVSNYPSTDKFQENSLYTGLAGKGTVKLNL